MKKMVYLFWIRHYNNICISPTIILGSFIYNVSQVPRPRSLDLAIDFQSFPCGLWHNPFLYHVNLFEIIHLVKFCGGGEDFIGKRPGL